ncbi:nuclear transport factor 2 family protein [Dyella terrae]|uniref:nuclear transport factor 2 family protein n=1 Tax=Dyella terrae TaxID=522259 RepID=UPI001EFD3A72|nr:nuclear transport factor 2 family protein [Dyella terrae]ULU26795.1 hypothetical protein DYST_03743 [Dyella terrae]
MHSQNRDYLRRLLDWNRLHLTSTSPLSDSDIAEVFAPQFVVKANGRTHPANHQNYLEFLNGFRRNVHAIDYDLHEEVAEGSSIVVAMTARVTRIGGAVDRFEAMLLLTFDQQGLVELWQEVYIQS